MAETAMDFSASVRRPKKRGTFNLWRARHLTLVVKQTDPSSWEPSLQIALNDFMQAVLRARNRVAHTSDVTHAAMITAPHHGDDLRQEFDALAEEWHAHTDHLSVVWQKAMHPA